jgi:hypothetical protein
MSWWPKCCWGAVGAGSWHLTFSSVGSDVKVNDKQSWKQVSKESNGLVGIEIQWIATTLIWAYNNGQGLGFRVSLGRIQDTNTIGPPFCDLGIMAKVDVLQRKQVEALVHYSPWNIPNIQHGYLNPWLIGNMDLGFVDFWSSCKRLPCERLVM